MKSLFGPAHLGELLSKLIQFLLQRSLLLLSGSHLVTNLTDLSGDTCGNSDAGGFSSCDIGALNRVLKEGENHQDVWWSLWGKVKNVCDIMGVGGVGAVLKW